MAVRGSEELVIRIPGDDREALDACADLYRTIRAEIGKVIVAQETVIEELLICLIADGHSLVVGVPGLAKTLLVSTLARILDLGFGRVQFTPDLMPSDITGTEILDHDPETGRRLFRFMAGPLFTNVLLADEINRTPPKTQAALLQAMQEREVTAGGTTHRLDPPFLVLATQNPIEQEGTYPLPEAQLDRFMFQVDISYPSFDDEVRIVEETTGEQTPDVRTVVDHQTVLRLQELVRRVPVARHIIESAVTLARHTRPEDESAPAFIRDAVRWGAGVRAGQFLVLAAKARALLYGKPTPDLGDIRAVALPVLCHRIVPSFRAEAEGTTPRDVVKRLVETSELFSIHSASLE
jgi:MoxR-like ATPase